VPVANPAGHPHPPRAVTAACCSAYGYARIDEEEARDRIAMGDAGGAANRVLHCAFLEDGSLVGCCSSTIQTPWCPAGCGHWGLLSVAPAAQGRGVASALVSAAEHRLTDAGCRSVQIEYEYVGGEPLSERLRAWYEDKCGFGCPSAPARRGARQFRRCRKLLLPEGGGRVANSYTAGCDACEGRVDALGWHDYRAARAMRSIARCIRRVLLGAD